MGTGWASCRNGFLTAWDTAPLETMKLSFYYLLLHVLYNCQGPTEEIVHVAKLMSFLFVKRDGPQFSKWEKMGFSFLQDCWEHQLELRCACCASLIAFVTFLSDAGLPQCGRDASGGEDRAWYGYAAGSRWDRDVWLQLQAVGPLPSALFPCPAVDRHAHWCQCSGTQDPRPGCDSPGRCLPGDPTSLVRWRQSSLKLVCGDSLAGTIGWVPVTTLGHV